MLQQFVDFEIETELRAALFHNICPCAKHKLNKAMSYFCLGEKFCGVLIVYNFFRSFILVRAFRRNFPAHWTTFSGMIMG